MDNGIFLNVNDYCAFCPEFEAHVEKVDITEMGDKTRKVLTAINCEYAERCERMYKRIQEGRANETTVVQCGV